MTDKYERAMQASYGAATRRLVFQQKDTLVVSDYREETVAGLNRHVSNCKVMSLHVSENPPDRSQSGPVDVNAALFVNVEYRLHSDPNTPSTLSVSIPDPASLNVFTPF